MNKDNDARNMVHKLVHKDIDIYDLKEVAKEKVESYDERAVDKMLQISRLSAFK